MARFSLCYCCCKNRTRQFGNEVSTRESFVHHQPLPSTFPLCPATWRLLSSFLLMIISTALSWNGITDCRKSSNTKQVKWQSQEADGRWGKAPVWAESWEMPTCPSRLQNNALGLYLPKQRWLKTRFGEKVTEDSERTTFKSSVGHHYQESTQSSWRAKVEKNFFVEADSFWPGHPISQTNLPHRVTVRKNKIAPIILSSLGGGQEKKVS